MHVCIAASLGACLLFFGLKQPLVSGSKVLFSFLCSSSVSFPFFRSKLQTWLLAISAGFTNVLFSTEAAGLYILTSTQGFHQAGLSFFILISCRLW